MSLLRPSVPFETVVTLSTLAPGEDFPWVFYELGGRLMVSYPVPQIRDYARSPLATLCSLLDCSKRGVRTFLPAERGDRLVFLAEKV